MKIKTSTGKDGSREYVSQKSINHCREIERVMGDYISRNQEAIEKAVLDLMVYGTSQFELSKDQSFKDDVNDRKE